jgi:DnaJ-class molecular chaperone
MPTMSATPMCYYQILGLAPDCTASQIATAYGQLSRQWHPDKQLATDDLTHAEKMFTQITKAYQILSDKQARANYDTHRVTVKTDNLIDPSDIFGHMVESDDQVPDVIVRITATIDQLYHGFTREVEFERYSPCERCVASGCENQGDDNTVTIKCAGCGGRGACLETVEGGRMGYMINEKKCLVCDGTGIDPEATKCEQCEGARYARESIVCEVDVPAGAYDMYSIRLENEGNYIPDDERKANGATRSDVVCVVSETNDMPDGSPCISRGMYIKELGRMNRADLLMRLDVSFADSIMGYNQLVRFLGQSMIHIHIDQPIQNNQIFVIRGKGMRLVPEEAIRSSHAYGDLFVVFRVEKPTMTRAQRNRIRQILTNTPYQCEPDQSDRNEGDAVHRVEHAIEYEVYVAEYQAEQSS